MVKKKKNMELRQLVALFAAGGALILMYGKAHAAKAAETNTVQH